MMVRLEVIAMRLGLADLEWAAMARLYKPLMTVMLDLAGFGWVKARLLKLEMWAAATRLNLSDFGWVVVRLRSGGLEQMVMLAVCEWAAMVGLCKLAMALILNLGSLERMIRLTVAARLCKLEMWVVATRLNLSDFGWEAVRLRSDGFERVVAGHHEL
jgi:hypothetical protein